MSKIGDLINKLCPNGVEYKSIGACCKIETGKLNANAAVENGEYMFFTTAKEPSKTDTYRWDEEALLIAGNANIGDVKHYKGKFNAYQRTYVLTNFSKDINVKYLYFSLSNNLKVYLDKHKNEAAMTYIVLSTLENFKVAVPPLEVQDEIVRILDNFTLLSAELSAELKARQKQYEYYREKIYTFNNDIPSKRLIDIAKISRGKRVTKKDLNDEEKYPVYQNTLTPMGYYKDKNYDKEKTYIISAGAAGEIGYSKEDFWAADDCLIVYDTKNVLNKYIYYYLLLKQDYIKSNVRKASIPRLSRNIIENLEIPIPSEERQERIVYILDKFDKLCSDLLEGLPAEIEARQKQYEYYRDKLLTFKELEIKEG